MKYHVIGIDILDSDAVRVCVESNNPKTAVMCARKFLEKGREDPEDLELYYIIEHEGNGKWLILGDRPNVKPDDLELEPLEWKIN